MKLFVVTIECHSIEGYSFTIEGIYDNINQASAKFYEKVTNDLNSIFPKNLLDENNNPIAYYQNDDIITQDNYLYVNSSSNEFMYEAQISEHILNKSNY